MFSNHLKKTLGLPSFLFQRSFFLSLIVLFLFGLNVSTGALKAFNDKPAFLVIETASGETFYYPLNWCHPPTSDTQNSSNSQDPEDSNIPFNSCPICKVASSDTLTLHPQPFHLIPTFTTDTHAFHITLHAPHSSFIPSLFLRGPPSLV